MRSIVISVILCLGMSISVALAQSGTAQESFTKALRSFTEGDSATAKTHLEEVLAADPKHRQAALLMQRIQMQERTGGNLEQRAASVIIPSFEVQDASLSTVLDYLPKAALENSNGTFALNIVRLFTPEFGKETPVTLSIRNAPISEILRYVAQSAGLQVQYQPHAVVLSTPAP